MNNDTKTISVDQDFSELSKRVFNAIGAEIFGAGKAARKSLDRISRGFLGDCYAVSTQLMALTLTDDSKQNIADANPQTTARLREVFAGLFVKCEKNEFDLAPYYEDDEMFGKEEDSENYRLPTRALAAALNMLSLALRDKIGDNILGLDEINSKKITEDEAGAKKIAEEEITTKRITDTVAKIMKYLSQSVVRESAKDDSGRSKAMGWTCYADVANNEAFCKARLFTFAETYLVIEALSRFADIYKNEGKKSELVELFARGNHAKTIETAMQCMREVAVNFYEFYSKSYGEEFFFLDENGNAKVQDIIASGSPVLFYPLYIALIAMNGFADVTYAKADIQENPELLEEYRQLLSGEEVKLDSFVEFKMQYDKIKNLPKAEALILKLRRLQKFLIKTKDAMDMVVKKARDLKDRQVDTELMDFSVGHGDGDIKMFSRINKRRVDSAYINPLIMSAKSLIIIALTKYPEKDMRERFDDLMSWRAKRRGEHLYLWSEDMTSAYSTERSVGAILYDYSYYYDKYERLYNDPATKIKEKETELSKKQAIHATELREKDAIISKLEQKIERLKHENTGLEKSAHDAGVLTGEIEKIATRKFLQLISASLDIYSLTNLLSRKEIESKPITRHIDDGAFRNFEALADATIKNLDRSDDRLLDEIGGRIIDVKDKLNQAMVTTLWSILLRDPDAVEKRTNPEWQKAIRLFPEDYSEFLRSGAMHVVSASAAGKSFDSLSNLYEKGILKQGDKKREQGE